MNVQVLGYSLCFVIFTNCVLYEARTLYSVDPYNYYVSKRSAIERRGFLKSFCARRCNIGKGGNLCKCNGFHFAGKRAPSLPVYHDDDRLDLGNDPEEMVYKILEENNKISIDPDKYTLRDGMLAEQDILNEIEDIFPKMMNGELEDRPPNAELGDLLETYLSNENL